MIKFDFTPTQDDYVLSFRTFYLANWQSWITMPIILSMIALGCFLVAMQGSARLDDKLASPAGLLAVGLMIGNGFFAYNLFFNNPLKAWKQVEENERLNCHVYYEVNEEQFLIRTKFAETKTDWGMFTSFIETPNLFLLIYSTNKNMFQIIPKRAFVSLNDEEAFGRLLLKKNMKEQRILGMLRQ